MKSKGGPGDPYLFKFGTAAILSSDLDAEIAVIFIANDANKTIRSNTDNS